MDDIKKGTSKTTLAIIGVVVIVVIVAALAFVLMSGSDDDDDNGGGTITPGAWTPAVGDYIEYEMSQPGAMSTTVTYRMEITSMTSTEMAILMTMSIPGMDPYSQTITQPLSQAFGNSYDIENPEPGTTVTDKGMESVTIKYGTISAHHYKVVYEDGGLTYTDNIWVVSGIVIKMTQEAEGSPTAYMNLKNTNIDVIKG